MVPKKSKRVKASLSKDKLKDSDSWLATADKTAKCQSICMGNLG